MRYLKLFGLVAAVAMAAIVVGGAGAASATVLCTAHESPCSALKQITTTQDSEIDADLILSRFEDPKATKLSECEGGTLKATISKAGGAAETVVATVATSGLTWGSCLFSTPTTAEGGELEIHHIFGTKNGTLTARNFEIVLKTASGPCTYSAGAGADLGMIRAEPPRIWINVRLGWKTGLIICPEYVHWTAEYAITKPNPIYVEPS